MKNTLRWSAGHRHPMRRGNAALISGALLALLVAAAGCGSGSGVPTLTWYINPDNGGQARLAETCAPPGGPYKVNIQTLPNDASQQREQLVRRLAAHDSSIDLMSLDPVFVAEFANAGFLHAFDKADQTQLTKGVLDAPLKTVYWNHQLIAAPFWANTQLLWYRKSAVKAAGIDPTSPNFTWDEMIKAAVKENKVIGVQASRYEGYMVWINALVLSAGGQIITNVDKGKDATPAIDSPAGDAAATIVGELARSKAAPPAMSNATEEEARSAFQSDRGMFMVNWPYVYAAAKVTRRPAPSSAASSTTSAGRGTPRRSPASPASRRSAGSTWRSGPTPSTRARPWRWSSASPR